MHEYSGSKAIAVVGEEVISIAGRYLGKLKPRPEHAISPISASPDGEWIVWPTLASAFGLPRNENRNGRIITALRYDGSVKSFHGLSGAQHATAVTDGATSVVIASFWARALELKVYQAGSTGPHLVVKLVELGSEDDRIGRLASSGDASVVVVGIGHKIFVIDTARSLVLLQERGEYPLISIDGRTILFVGPGADLRRRVISNQESESILSSVKVRALGAVTPDGSFVTLGFDKTWGWRTELGCFDLANRKLFRITTLGEGDLGDTTAWVNAKWAG